MVRGRHRSDPTVTLVSSLALMALSLPGAAGCGNGGTEPEPGGEDRFRRSISLDLLGERLAGARGARVEVALRPGELVAREVEVDPAAEFGRDEEAEGPITAVSRAGNAGTLTLATGGLEVGFDAATRFHSEGGVELGMDAFVARVQAALSAGREPGVEARRPAATPPAAPDDRTFMAATLELDDEASEPRLELHVDGDNLERNDAPPPAAWLQVLGLRVEIRSGVTELTEERELAGDRVEFEGMVVAADAASGATTLEDGRVAVITADTKVEGGNDAEDILSLQQLVDAVAAELWVEADGEGIVESERPERILATRVELGVEEVDEVPGAFEFEDEVTAVDPGAGRFTLAGGAVVRVTSRTAIDSEGDLHSLEAVGDALSAGDSVKTEGFAVETDSDPPPVWRALVVKFESG